VRLTSTQVKYVRFGLAPQTSTQPAFEYAATQADSASQRVADSRAVARYVAAAHGPAARICWAFVRAYVKSPVLRSQEHCTCSLVAATKLLHAVFAQRKLLTSQLNSRSSLQSLIGATEILRSKLFIAR
jgi:hypothetical protein